MREPIIVKIFKNDKGGKIVLSSLSGAVLAKVIILAAVILFIQKHPRGLFPQKGRDAED